MPLAFDHHEARRLRLERDITVADAAEALGITRQGLAKIEAGTSEPRASTAFALAELLGVEARELWVAS